MRSLRNQLSVAAFPLENFRTNRNLTTGKSRFFVAYPQAPARAVFSHLIKRATLPKKDFFRPATFFSRKIRTKLKIQRQQKQRPNRKICRSLLLLLLPHRCRRSQPRLLRIPLLQIMRRISRQYQRESTSRSYPTKRSSTYFEATMSSRVLPSTRRSVPSTSILSSNPK